MPILNKNKYDKKFLAIFKNYFKVIMALLIIFIPFWSANASENLTRITDSGGTIYFAHDFESGNIAPDQGTGAISHLGGNVSKPVGDYSSSCTIDAGNFHYSYFSDTAVAQGAVMGSMKSLITPYLGNCPNESSPRDITVISTPLLSEYYVRWYQKWTGSFQNSVQQKFTKFYNSNDYSGSTLTGHLSMRPDSTPLATTGLLENFMPSIEGHFNKSGCVLANGNIWITPVTIEQGDCYTGQAKGFDDSALTNTPIIVELDRWYAFEIHSKLNTSPSVADAVFEIWIDGIKRMDVTNFKFRDGGTFNTPGTNQFEFQHVYYNRSNQDQSTYMDNVVIADKYIGPIVLSEEGDVIAPSAPVNLNVL